MTDFSIDQQIEEVERELEKCGDVYARLVSAGKMKRSLAEFHTARMTAALRTLQWMRDNRAVVLAAHADRPPPVKAFAP